MFTFSLLYKLFVTALTVEYLPGTERMGYQAAPNGFSNSNVPALADNHSQDLLCPRMSIWNKHMNALGPIGRDIWGQVTLPWGLPGTREDGQHIPGHDSRGARTHRPSRESQNCLQTVPLVHSGLNRPSEGHRFRLMPELQ